MGSILKTMMYVVCRRPTHHYATKTDRGSPNYTRTYSLFPRIAEIKMFSIIF
jgi:hypothetical protein